MGYYIDLEGISINEYKEEIENGYLPPTRRLLKDDIEERFDDIKKQGITTAQGILDALKTKKKTEDFAEKSGIDIEYLTILSREIRSIIKKPVMINDFTMISAEAKEGLKKFGIKNTLQIYELLLTKTDRKALCSKTGIGEEEMLMTACLVDLSRIRWVNHTFAQILYNLGCRSAKEVAAEDAYVLHKKVNEYIKQNGIYREGIGLNDIKTCIRAAGMLEAELE